ncbi:hypothetical protein EYF80_047392 [Liparis tanakae]|uniref:Uncharacterized protein n=1 Tax=Liparis tanakae TaxID=230148 RepID=A0A4Z2FMT5_9TELE|nr:hypothetical protein EYF80_047392 [Liparis tanakae]
MEDLPELLPVHEAVPVPEGEKQQENPALRRALSSSYLSKIRKHSESSSSLLPAWSSLSCCTIITKNSSKSMVENQVEPGGTRWNQVDLSPLSSPSSSTSSMMASSSSLDGFWPSILITWPSSLVLMSPPPSVSNMSKAALNSGGGRGGGGGGRGGGRG